MHLYINGAGFMLLTAYLIVQIIISVSTISKMLDDDVSAIGLLVLINLVVTVIMFIIILMASAA